MSLQWYLIVWGLTPKEVVDAMNTKWNALGFTPGLVGGHCIGVDPYYFVYEAEKLGYHSQIVLSGRKINDGMGKFIADEIIKKLILANKVVRQAKVAILGITFKENTPDVRNSKVVDIIRNLEEYGIEPIVVDPKANKEDAFIEYGIELVEIEKLTDIDCIVLAVLHKEFLEFDIDYLKSLYTTNNNNRIFFDIKSGFDKKLLSSNGFEVWEIVNNV